VPTRLRPFINQTKTAYFTMEMAIRPEMHTYSGGLGILAGDTARSCADLTLPLVFVTLVSRAGYFCQRFDGDGRQVEEDDCWQPGDFCTPLNAMIALEIEGRPVWIRPWLYRLASPHGNEVPVLLLDTDLDQNAPEDRAITHYLYGNGEAYRLKQEIVLGIGGCRLLRALGFDIDLYHMNEGHAALLTLDLLNRRRHPSAGYPGIPPETHVDAVRDHCVFTTHTPVEAGHDKFRYDLFERLFPDFIPLDELRQLAGHDRLNMTRLALNLSSFVNGVAHRHAETTERMFPGYRIRAVTNGVHLGTWVHECFAALFDTAVPHWQHEPELLIRVLQLDEEEIWRCHMQAKDALLDHVRAASGVTLAQDKLTIGFARRMTGYKRPLLLFEDIDRLRSIAGNRPFQMVMAGKAHPNDAEGKEAIRRLHEIADTLRGEIDIVFLPDYDLRLAQLLVSGVDLWLNTPQPPMEASGTSGMKAAMNGVLNLSTLDGWWLEACIDSVTGWSIGSEGDNPDTHALALLDKLENTVLPSFYDDPARWRWMMKRSIAYIASCFNSQRMMRRYTSEAYFR